MGGPARSPRRAGGNGVVEALDGAFEWLCENKKQWPDAAEVWSFRRHRPEHLAEISAALVARLLRFSAQRTFTSTSGDTGHLWCDSDGVALKVLTTNLAVVLPVSRRCAHVKGHGGLRAAVRDAANTLPQHRFAYRTDLKSYYDSIGHGLLIERLKRHVSDERVLELVRQYLNPTTERGGIFKTFTKGISRGCLLSPFICAFYLHDLDARMEQQAAREGLFYVRYMDDILVLAPTRWKLRRAIRTVNEELATLGLEQHPDKTFVGRISHGFDFLGYHFKMDGNGNAMLTLAAKTIQNFQTKLSRLYELWHRASPKRRMVLEVKINTHVDRWNGWANRGIG